MWKTSEIACNGNGSYLNERQIWKRAWFDLSNQNANDKVVKEEKTEGEEVSGAAGRTLWEWILHNTLFFNTVFD